MYILILVPKRYSFSIESRPHTCILCMSPVERSAFVVTEGGIDGGVWKELQQLLDGVAHCLGVGVLGLVPDVMRWQISRPDDVSHVLRGW